MRACRFGKSLGRPCDDDYSILVLCERDGVIRCLRECMRSCGDYESKSEPPSPRLSPYGVQPKASVSAYGGGSGGRATSGCGVPCGGTGKR